MLKLFQSLLGDPSERIVKDLRESLVQEVNALEPEFEGLSEAALRGKLEELRERAKAEPLEALMPETFALVREASKRVLGQRHHDVQLIGGAVLFSGKIAEMRTGEGKTLVATLPLALNALEGRGGHLVTPNDYQFAKHMPRLQAERDYRVDEKLRTATLTEEGVTTMEHLLGVDNLTDPQHIELMHHAQQALRAHTLYHRDVEYVVKDGQVIIVDEFTGRLMFGRRYSDGLHQAIEAKEGVRIEKESQTLATITFQNYFRMYHKLAGMTGTAKTEEAELTQIYNLPVVVVPTDRPMVREDLPDLVYKQEKGKIQAVADELEEWYKQRRRVLVGP